MQKNKYIFCGCKTELICNEPILAESTFSIFRADFDSADYSLRVERTDALPQKKGKPVLLSERRKVYSGSDRYEYTSYYDIKQKKYVEFACKVNDSVLYICYPDKLREITVFDGLDLPDMLLKRNIGILHCSFIEYQGNAILFAGKKESGKSTQAALWEKHRNAQIINGDRAAVICENGKLFACGIPFCGTSKICKNKKFPLKAVVCLSKGDSNTASKLSALNAFIEVLGCFTYNCQDKNASDAISALTAKFRPAALRKSYIRPIFPIFRKRRSHSH